MNTDSFNAIVFSNSELKVLRDLSSFDFGFIKFNTPKGVLKKQILEKAITSLDTQLSQIVNIYKDKKIVEEEHLATESDLVNIEKQKLDLYEKYCKTLSDNTDSHIYLYLGHFQLLLHLYEDALSAYLEFESRDIHHWKNVQFLYGLAICYFHFSAFHKAIELFQTILYLQPGCYKAKEIHIRLGYIYKLNKNFDSSLRHFKQALNDTVKGSFSETEIRFQIAHLLEVCGKYKQAQKAYEQLISFNKEEVPDHIKHLCFRQLGWLHFSGNIKSPISSSPNSTTVSKKDSVIALLHQAITLDDSSGKTWYLFGRAQAKENKVQEAFMAYRNSIDKTEANADTWCSIGVLYQEQNQPMDALQAYFCACQLDRKHIAAWTNLGVLYESMGQHKEALKCYQNAVSSDKNNEIRSEIKERMTIIQKLLSNTYTENCSKPSPGGNNNMPNNAITTNGPMNLGQVPHNNHNNLMLQQKMRPTNNPSMSGLAAQNNNAINSQGGPTMNNVTTNNMTNQSPGSAGVGGGGGIVMKLPTVDEAWNLPIPTELTQRQMQLEMQEAVASSSSGNNAASRLFAHHLPPYLANNSNNSSSNSNSNNLDSNSIDHELSSKRRKLDDHSSQDIILPLTAQQTQLLHTLESKSNQLNSQEHQTLMQLQEQYQRYLQQRNNHNSQVPQDSNQTNSNSTQSFDRKPNMSSLSNHDSTTTNNNNVNNNNNSNNATDDLHLIHSLEEIPDDYEHEFMANIDALLNDPISNFDEHFDETNTNQSNNTNSICKKEPTTHQMSQSEEPVTDLLNYLRSFNDDRPVFVSPVDEFKITMTSSQIIDRVTRLASDIHERPWSITYLPGNRIPKPPPPPPPPSSISANVQPNGNNNSNSNILNVNSNNSITTLNNINNSSNNTSSNNSISSVNGGNSKNNLLPTNANGNCNNNNNNISTNNSISRQNSEYFQLSPPTPSVYLDCKKDVHSPELRQFCLSQPVVVVRNLASTLRMDLGVFSTKSLVECNPTHKIEQRIQDSQAADENKDATGKTVMRCYSSRSTTTIQDYANYQAKTFVEAKKEEKTSNGLNSNGHNGSTFLNGVGGIHSEEPKVSTPNTNDTSSSSDDKKKKNKKILFGTNCDLSDESKWFTQLHELGKLPNFLRVVSACNMLSHVGCVIQGMNSVQLYMKIPGCRTPGHQENNQFCSVNINVGPGDCEWFCVPEQYWGAINDICESHGLDYLSGSWWPSLDELRQHYIPVYRFIQRPGDLVWINSGTVHWVQAIGWCNNVAWNVGPLVSRQYSLAMERYEYNKLRHYQSIVPMLHLSWQLARNIKMTDSHLYQLIKYTLMVSLIHSSLISNYLEKHDVTMVLQPREENEPTQVCVDCDAEVFNIFLIKQVKSNSTSASASSTPNTKKSSNNNSTTKDVQYETRCLNCALKLSPNLNMFKAIYQFKLAELKETYDSFKFQSTPISAYSVSR